MQRSEIIDAIDKEVEILRQARKLLIGGTEVVAPARRLLSAEGKARIAAAQKARWVSQRTVEKVSKKSLVLSAKKAVGKKISRKSAKPVAAKKRSVTQSPGSSSATEGNATTT